MTRRVKTIRLTLLCFSLGIYLESLMNSTFANDYLPTNAQEIKMLSLEPLDLNFAFENDEKFLFQDRESFSQFWKENSRVWNAEAPELTIKWETENLIAIMWKSEDDLIRLPSLSRFRYEAAGGIRIESFLITPCFGIITDASPTMFLVVPKDKIKEVSQITLETSSGSLNCF